MSGLSGEEVAKPEELRMKQEPTLIKSDEEGEGEPE